MNYILDDTLFPNIQIFDSDEQLSNAAVAVGAAILRSKFGKQAQDKQCSVCILMDRGAKYIAAVFAAWKAGFYVVPLNKAWPVQKNTEIINQIGPACVLIDEEASTQHLLSPTMLANDLFPSDYICEKDGERREEASLLPSDIAYIIFTSGSTGEPKGVVISAGAFRSYIDWTKRNLREYSYAKKLLLTSELTFDITMGDIAFSLAFGTSIGVAKQHANIPAVLAMIMRHEIDVLYSVPTTHLALVEFSKKKRGADLSSLRLVLSGGDKFPWQLVEDYQKLAKDAHFFNVYGPTEVTINCFSIRLDDLLSTDLALDPVPIGHCFDSLDYVFLDEEGQLSDRGELCVTGPQVMLGYYGDINSTLSSLVDDPRLAFVKRILYRTGDLGFRKNGLVYIEGRIDSLVKIQGYRVHPDEVSKALDAIEFVEMNAVITDGTNEKVSLLAFLKWSGPIPFDEETMVLKLEALIPSYMIPKTFILMDKFPLNQSGKIDKNALSKYCR